MANINSLMSNSSSATSSLYGTRNVLTGLASGMDTEAMIENSVAGYKTKITQLEQQQTKTQWKQDAYRSITDKLYAMNQTYTSYTSKSNLFSNAFFNNAVTTSAKAVGANGAANVDKVSATGKSSSDIEILAAQTATAARYSADASSLGLNIPGATGNNIQTGKITVGSLQGTLTFTYDSQRVEISFDESDDNITTVEQLRKAIEMKLGEQKIGSDKANLLIDVAVSGNSIQFTDSGGNGASPYISDATGNLASMLGFTPSSSATSVTFPAAGTQKDVSMAEYLNGKQINVTLDGVTKAITLSGLTSTNSNGDALKTDSLKSALQTELNRNFGNGKITVNITGGKLDFTLQNGNSTLAVAAQNSKVASALGLGNAGVTNYLNVEDSIESLIGADFFTGTSPAKAASGVTFTAETNNAGFYKGSDGNRYQKDGSNYYRVNDSDQRLYELKINNESVYVAKEDSLQNVLSAINSSDAGVKASYSKLTGKIVFDSKETGAASGVSFDSPLAQRLFAAKNNGLKLGDILDDSWFGPDGKVKLYSTASENIGSSAYKGVFTKESKLSDFLEAFNLKSSGVQLADSSSTTIVGNNTESLTGYGLRLEKVSPNPNLNIKITNGTTDGGYDKEMSISKFIDLVNNFGREQGRDATVVAKVNGEEVTLNRSSNTIDMDGMSVTFKESFNVQTNENGVFQGIDKTDGSEAIAFKTSSDADSVYKTVKEFVDSYNAILKEIHDAYATQPAEKNSSTHAKYEPLTDDDKSGMSESAIKSYEEKAKQGILFGDSDLSALYSRLLSVFSNGSNVGALRDMGITTTFSNGLTQISFNETKFREALDNDPDKVRDTFTKSKEYGAASDGIMTGIKSTLEQYASTSIATPGILVKKAGSTFSSNSLLSNTMQTQIDNVQKQIEKWQSKMSAKIDYYTRQFTALEKLMNTMNSQSSALAGLMGG